MSRTPSIATSMAPVLFSLTLAACPHAGKIDSLGEQSALQQMCHYEDSHVPCDQASSLQAAVSNRGEIVSAIQNLANRAASELDLGDIRPVGDVVDFVIEPERCYKMWFHFRTDMGLVKDGLCISDSYPDKVTDEDPNSCQELYNRFSAGCCTLVNERGGYRYADLLSLASVHYATDRKPTSSSVVNGSWYIDGLPPGYNVQFVIIPNSYGLSEERRDSLKDADLKTKSNGGSFMGVFYTPPEGPERWSGFVFDRGVLGEK